MQGARSRSPKAPATSDPARPFRRWLYCCMAIFAAAVAVSAIQPWFPSDWWLENGLAWILVGALFFTRNVFPFSRVSYTLIFVFLLFHELGAHYTYSEVPYRDWFPFLATERNHYDRLVHLLFGLLFAYPIRELFLRVVHVRGFWSYYLPLDLTMSCSMLYELIEWGAAMVLGGDLGMAYLGTQGDEWDAHKDMLLATVGALITMLIVAAIHWRYGPISLEGRHRPTADEPLGEVALERAKGADGSKA